MTESSCACHGNTKRAERDPVYRTALMIVVALNLGFGVIELVGRFLASSQALKADSLDFLGDGSISLLGLLALAWGARARARVALSQGIFLGVLGVGVLGFAIWRAFHADLPQAALMGGIGAVALVINVASALILSRFRNGELRHFEVCGAVHVVKRHLPHFPNERRQEAEHGNVQFGLVQASGLHLCSPSRALSHAVTTN